MKPSIPKGTRDFSPEEVIKRQYIIQTIKIAFENFGFQPIETPSFENSETLMGKYGDEGDRLIFKILNSGEYLLKFNESLVSFIRFSLIYFRDFLKKKNDQFDLNDYHTQYKKNLSTYLKSKNIFIFRDEKISEVELLDDVFNLILESININDFDLLSKSDNELDEFVKSIFADFYYRLKYKYLTEYISEKALRYDLTVPFARYVVQHQNEITFPFKRYQIQPVWRADRPQKGRFREFYQCDADVVGSQSLWQEVEFVQLYDAVFTNLKLQGTTIKINNRKILSGIAEVIGAQENLIDFTVALDKLDKIGRAGVEAEMLIKGITENSIQKATPLFELKGSNPQIINQLSEFLTTSETGTKGVEELQFVIETIEKLGLQTATLQIDVTLARGLNYYTGAIFEVAAPPKVQMGSIGGGGRYDDLTGIFGLPNVSGIGISFGLDRIYLVLEELGMFDAVQTPQPTVLFINFGAKEALYCIQAIKELREKNIKAELYPDDAKLKKQFAYADKRNIPFTVIVGSEEIENQQFALKNMKTGAQVKCNLLELINNIKL